MNTGFFVFCVWLIICCIIGVLIAEVFVKPEMVPDNDNLQLIGNIRFAGGGIGVVAGFVCAFVSAAIHDLSDRKPRSCDDDD